MSKDRTTSLQDTKVDVKVVLSGLWISMLFVFAYVDIFGFWRADVIDGALAGVVPGPGFAIDQAFLVYTTVYILVPSLMVVVTLLAPARMNRVTNIVVSLVYLASVAVSMVGETWIYYILGSVVEVLLLLAIARAAWTWPRRPSPVTTTGSHVEVSGVSHDRDDWRLAVGQQRRQDAVDGPGQQVQVGGGHRHVHVGSRRWRKSVATTRCGLREDPPHERGLADAGLPATKTIRP